MTNRVAIQNERRVIIAVKAVQTSREFETMEEIIRLKPLAAAACVLTACLMAGCAAQEDMVQEIDPGADTNLRRMCDTLDRLKAFSFRVDAVMDGLVDTGQLAQFHRSSSVTMVRPDRLHVETVSDDGTWSVWYRGRELAILDRDSNAYATETVPGRIDQMLDYMADEYDVVMPMADLLIGKTYDSLLANVEVGRYLGLHSVGDTPCHHLLFRQEDLDWQIWIDAGDQPFPRKLVLTYQDEPDQPQYVAVLSDWKPEPSISDEIFAFSPPENATRVQLAELTAKE